MKFVSRRGVGEDLERARELILAKGGEMGRELHLLADAESTNDEAKRAAKSGAPHGSVWVAEVQTKGRGRQGRAWVSPPGENLLFSVLLRVSCPPARLPPLALVAGLAVRDAVARAAPKADAEAQVAERRAGRAERKIAGVLVEATLSGQRVEAVVVGVGLNVHTRDFGEELQDRATSVALVADGRPIEASLLADVLEGLDRDMALVRRARPRARARAPDRGRRARRDDGSAPRASRASPEASISTVSSSSSATTAYACASPRARCTSVDARRAADRDVDLGVGRALEVVARLAEELDLAVGRVVPAPVGLAVVRRVLALVELGRGAAVDRLAHVDLASVDDASVGRGQLEDAAEHLAAHLAIASATACAL